MGYRKALEILKAVEEQSDSILEPDDKVEEVTPSIGIAYSGQCPNKEAEGKSSGEGSSITAYETLNKKESREYTDKEPTAEEELYEGERQHLTSDDKQSEASGIGQVKVGESAVSSSVTQDDVARGNSENNLADQRASEENLGVVTREVDTTRTALATATIFPLSLLGNKRAWVWILVLVCVIIAAYFLWRRYSKWKEVTLPTSDKTKASSGDPVRDFMDNYR